MIPIKFTWKQNAQMIEMYHLNQYTIDQNWSIRKTSEYLGRSLGSVSEDLRLSLAIRFYPEVSEFRCRQEAIDFLKLKGKCSIYPYRDWSAEQVKVIVESLKENLQGA